ncbi:hypothetical protein A3E17_02320 [Candidatus Amesbacteria bacterium RIFCSPHIGHO2_12_FULL_48_14]|uniref:Uncharacterized protein n=1 Tax=Candidatus Amesbacteria bacterium RIFCSPHIGHO2_12_FULL_48_14 TaxID=1797257 RepID=A0A1F4ZD32_9BACT|nr:MAG: hypothetical protein A3E17_02320 [Candidatus Amesbacteria bacterium RIFCSPHIGHO2_12_FULL_48_14]
MPISKRFFSYLLLYTIFISVFITFFSQTARPKIYSVHIPDTSSWQTHTSPSFEFKYPPDWTIESSGNDRWKLLVKNAGRSQVALIDTSTFFTEINSLPCNPSNCRIETVNPPSIGRVDIKWYASQGQAIIDISGAYGIVFNFTATSPQDKERLKQLLSTFRFIYPSISSAPIPSSPVCSLSQPAPAPPGWKKFTDAKQGYEFSYPAAYAFRNDSFTAVSKHTSQGLITLYMSPDSQGSPCANAACNQQRDISLTLCDKNYTTSQIWPYHDGLYTFKISLASPHEYSLDVGASYPNESDLAELNSILKTIRFIPENTSTQTATPTEPCKISGCSSELCIDASSPDIGSVCIYRNEYSCYRFSACEKQSNGQCAWTQTPQYLFCLNNLPK